MPNCNPELFEFPSFDRRKIEGSFTGGDVSSDGGIMALREADRCVGLLRALDAAIEHPRNPDLITHRQVDLLRQRVFGLALGYEDLNDHDTLRHDLLWQSAVERDEQLASIPTLFRLENRAERQTAVAMSRVLVEKFIASFREPPQELILDFDATDDRVHGLQQGQMENRIKEQQLGLFADRTSCHGWWANQFRLLLSSAAYVLMEHIRRVALVGTELARAQVATIRLKLLKIGTVILRNTRRIRLLFSSAYPHQELFTTMIGRLSSA